MSRLILCADDFALSRVVSETIAALLTAGKLNATSCMTIMPGWRADAATAARAARFDRGRPAPDADGRAAVDPDAAAGPVGVLPRIDPLTWEAIRGRVPLDEIGAEVTAQFDAFIDAMGRPPDFVDGHQHAHALPGIRDLVLDETARRAPSAWLRDCTDGLDAMLARPFAGKAIGSAFHSRGLRDAAARYGLRCNDSFAGHYGFSGDYRTLFPRFLRRPGGMHLVMCHPGTGAPPEDTIAAARAGEAAALRDLPVARLAAAAGLAFAA